jgi:peptidoglycan/xylan/chitin deacetylase (PgdA/CDA1 family)
VTLYERTKDSVLSNNPKKTVDKTLISLTFDDGLHSQFEHAVPILDKYGFPATFFLIANSDPVHTDGYIHPDWRKTTWTAPEVVFLKDLIHRGHEIGSHSVTHRLPELDEDPSFEAERSKKWIETRMGVEIASYCYPFCHISRRIKRAVQKANYKQGRWGSNRTYRPSSWDGDFYQVDCRHVGVDSPMVVVVDGTSYPAAADGSENVRGWLQSDWYVLMFHGIGTIQDGWWPVSVPEFTRQMGELATLRDAGEVEVVTFNEGAERIRSGKF